jgi:hypothetical protein
LSSYVYVIGHTDGPNKVGITSGPRQRLAEFQCVSPVQLRHRWFRCESWEDAVALERATHVHLKKYRQRGEWFAVDAEAAEQAVEQTANRVGIPIATADELALIGGPNPRRVDGIARRHQISFRATDEVRDALAQLAQESDRSVSWLAGEVIEEWLVAHGHLPPRLNE